jgi:hypothetical protein
MPESHGVQPNQQWKHEDLKNKRDEAPTSSPLRFLF